MTHPKSADAAQENASGAVESEAAAPSGEPNAAEGQPSKTEAEVKTESAGGGRPVTLDALTDGPDGAAASSAGASTGSEAGMSAAKAYARIAELEAQLADAQAQIKGLDEQKLRLVAEVQNTVRRADRDKRDAETYGGTKLARDILSVFDNLDATLGHASDELREREPGFFNGVDLTRKELLNAFAKHRIAPIAPKTGEKFDPNLHQAMYEAPTPGVAPGCVIQVMQSGFMIADRLLRPALVGVASAGSTPNAEHDADDA